MNRRQAIAAGIGVTAATLVPKATDAVYQRPTPDIYYQWTGYHWVQITDGIVSHVHNGDEWFALEPETLDVNMRESV